MIARSVERKTESSAPIGCCTVRIYFECSNCVMPKHRTKAQKAECHAAGHVLKKDQSTKYKRKAARELATNCKKTAVKKPKKR